MGAAILPKYWIKADRNRLERHTTQPTIYGLNTGRNVVHTLLLLFCVARLIFYFCVYYAHVHSFSQTKWWHKQQAYATNNYNVHKNNQLQLHNDCTTWNIKMPWDKRNQNAHIQCTGQGFKALYEFFYSDGNLSRNE